MKDHCEAEAKRLGYPSTSELVREAILFRIAWQALRETDSDAQAAEELLRRLM